MAKGGKRPGAGRKKKVDEELVKTLAVKAIRKKFGSEEKGFAHLLESGDSGLVKWVFEHGYGKPKEKVEVKHDGGISIVFKKAENANQ